MSSFLFPSRYVCVLLPMWLVQVYFWLESIDEVCAYEIINSSNLEREGKQARTRELSQWLRIIKLTKSRWLLQKALTCQWMWTSEWERERASERKNDRKTLVIQLEPIIPFHRLSWFYVSFRRVFIMMVLFDSIIEHGHETFTNKRSFSSGGARAMSWKRD